MPMGKKRYQKKGVTVKELFTPRRHPRAPLAVQDKAALWLDLYVDFAAALVTKDQDQNLFSSHIVELAQDLADRSLDAFEKRWPTAEVPRG